MHLSFQNISRRGSSPNLVFNIKSWALTIQKGRFYLLQ